MLISFASPSRPRSADPVDVAVTGGHGHRVARVIPTGESSATTRARVRTQGLRLRWCASFRWTGHVSVCPVPTEPASASAARASLSAYTSYAEIGSSVAVTVPGAPSPVHPGYTYVLSCHTCYSGY